jgi:hypothetical protein
VSLVNTLEHLERQFRFGLETHRREAMPAS